MAIANDGNCFRCGLPGHWIQHCPLGIAAATMAEHLARIDAIVRRWTEFAITIHEKQKLIREENELWKPKTGAGK